MTRILNTVALTVVALLLLPGVASAHAQLDKSPVPGGTVQTLTIRALSERPLEHNTEMEIRIPDGFSQAGCVEKASWTCVVEETSAGVVVHFTRTAGQDVLIDDTYAFTVRAADQPGMYLFPTIQTYSSGEEVGWVNSDANGEGPAPRLEVTAGGPATANTEAAPDHSPPGGEPAAAPAEPASQPASAAPQPAPAPGPAAPQPAPAPAPAPAARPAGFSESASTTTQGTVATPAPVATAVPGESATEDVDLLADAIVPDQTAPRPALAVSDEAEDAGAGRWVVAGSGLAALSGGGILLARRRGLLGGTVGE